MAKLDRLLRPRSVAVIGGREAGAVIRQLRQVGFAGDIWPVNPRRESLEEIACFTSLDALPAPPDAAFVAVPNVATIETVSRLRMAGCGGAVCYASGFGELGQAGKALEAELLSAAGDMPVFGPNCYGFINYLDRCALWPDEHGGRPVERGVAIVTQSGNMGMNFTMQRRGMPLAGLYTLGNQARITITDMVAALAADPRVTAIGLHIEGLADMRAFTDACRVARETATPVVALKTGRSSAAARITESHTSSLAGPDRLYDALFRRTGVARVDTVPELLETLKFLHFNGVPDGRAICSLSCSGGEAALVADLADRHGLVFRALETAHRDRVRATLNDYVDVSNPLDYHTFIWGRAEETEACFTAMLSGGFDTSMLIIDFPNRSDLDASAWHLTTRAFTAAARAIGARGVVVATMPECLPEDAMDELSSEGIAPMTGLDECLTAISAAAGIGEAWARPDIANLLPGMPLPVVKPRSLDEHDAKVRLAEYGLAVPNGVVCTREEVRRSADALGYPVALKALSETLTHKSEADGVKIGLDGGDDVERAAAGMAELSDRFLVETMVTDTVAEIIVGIEADPQFGLALVIGAGGVLTELVRDSATILLPCTKDDVADAIDGLQVKTLLDGFRGKPAGDTAALVSAVMTIARFAADHRGSLAGLDINPLLVRPKGRGVCGVDAWMAFHAEQ